MVVQAGIVSGGMDLEGLAVGGSQSRVELADRAGRAEGGRPSSLAGPVCESVDNRGHVLRTQTVVGGGGG